MHKSSARDISVKFGLAEKRERSGKCGKTYKSRPPHKRGQPHKRDPWRNYGPADKRAHDTCVECGLADKRGRTDKRALPKNRGTANKRGPT